MTLKLRCSGVLISGKSEQIGRIVLISGEIGTVQVKSVHCSVYIVFKRYIIGFKSYMLGVCSTENFETVSLPNFCINLNSTVWDFYPLKTTV